MMQSKNSGIFSDPKNPPPPPPPVTGTMSDFDGASTSVDSVAVFLPSLPSLSLVSLPQSSLLPTMGSELP